MSTLSHIATLTAAALWSLAAVVPASAAEPGDGRNPEAGVAAAATHATASPATAAPTDRPPFGEPPPSGAGPRPARRGPGGPGGPGGMGGVQPRLKLVPQFDQDGDKRLNAAERKAARAFLAKEKAEGRGSRRMGPWGRDDSTPAGTAGPKLTPADVANYADAALYDETVLRTLFIDFEEADWEHELSDFYHTDVDVAARLQTDGKTYNDVGVHFRGASSFFTVSQGRKRSLSLALDFAHKDQQLGGYHTLNLLNAHTDPTFLRSVLYYRIARQYVPAPKANFVRLVINGESWGVYINAQQFNKQFATEWFGSTKGARWKVPGSPRGNGGLGYLGDDVAPYKRLYELKTKDTPKAWLELASLCRVLNQTPAEQSEKALEPILDVPGALKFLALENVFINNDGYWTRASDYDLFLDAQGRFHTIPYDGNETFRVPEGPAWGGGGDANGGGVSLSPLAGTQDPNKPLLSKLLAVPALKTRYFGYVRLLAERELDWAKLGPVVGRFQALIAEDVKTDAHKLYSTEAFAQGATQEIQESGFHGPQSALGLRQFVEQRRAYLLGLAEVKNAPIPADAKAQ